MTSDMEQPMLSVDQRQGSSCDKATPNVLPCRIQHDGPISEADSYWKPSQEPDGKRVAYFRGRKLHGKALTVPEGYRGVVVDRTDPPKPQALKSDEPEVVDLDAEDEIPLGALEAKAEFDEMVIWGHESVADTSSDPYVRGVEEWMKLAEKVRVACEWKVYSYTDMFRYILMRQRGSEVVLEDIRQGLILRICRACAWNTQDSEASPS